MAGVKRGLESRRSRSENTLEATVGRGRVDQFSPWNMGMYEMPTIAPSGDCSLATV